MNDKPDAQDDTATVGEDSSATINVTDNKTGMKIHLANNHPMEEVLAVSVAGACARYGSGRYEIIPLHIRLQQTGMERIRLPMY